MTEVTRSVSSTQFFFLALRRLRTFISRVKLSLENDKDFIKREPTPLLTYETKEDITYDLKNKLEELIKLFPNVSIIQKPVLSICENLLSHQENGLLLLNEYHKLLDLELKWLPKETRDGKDDVEISADKDSVQFKFADSENTKFPEIDNSIKEQLADISFLAKITGLNQISRKRKTKKTIEQFAAIEAGYYFLKSGAVLPNFYQGLGTSGFRDIQTYLSVADPGEGHINVTSLHQDLLKGAIVHIEHIDRDKEANKEIVEPYRLPALVNAVKVRLHIGKDSPCTAFIGRPVFENHKKEGDPKFFEFDLLKTSHLIASTCSAFFGIGIADCKIAIERMTFNQAISFMKAVVGNVVRDEYTQYLSAAFNINTPIMDDRQEEIKEIKKPFEIALAGIDIAVQGGFNKVTWDGASNQIPSVPIIDQLSHAEIVELVHRAHENGLETYISAGMKPPHMEPAVHTGVDGVGIGTSLHYKDPKTKLMGALKPEAIQEVLDFRDKAANSILGTAAKMLAKLDRLFFENLLSNDQDKNRIELVEKLKAKDIPSIERILEKIENINILPTGGHPIIQQSQRLLSCAMSNEFMITLPNKVISEVNAAIENNDLEKLKNILLQQKKGF